MSTLDIVTRTYVDLELRYRLAYRRFYRDMDPERRATYYADLDRENTVVLRELLRIRRLARREAARQDARVPTKAERVAAIAEAFDIEAGDYYAGDHHVYPMGVGR